MIPVDHIKRITLQEDEIEKLRQTLNTERTDQVTWHTGDSDRLVVRSISGERVFLKGCSSRYCCIDYTNRSSEKERSFLEKIDHPNVVKTVSIEGLETILQPLATEYINGQTLKEFTQSKELNPAEIKHIVKQLFRGVSTIHESGIWHTDLFARNIMIDDDLNIKIVDFGSSERNSSRAAQLHDTSQVLHVILFLVFKEHNFHGFNPTYVKDKISNLEKNEKYNELYQFLDYVNKNEVTAREALSHSFIS